VTDVIHVSLNMPRPSLVTSNVAASEGKNSDEGTMIWPFEHESESNPVAAADPPETQSLTPAMTKGAPDLLIH
jgi:hypothetical protein